MRNSINKTFEQVQVAWWRSYAGSGPWALGGGAALTQLMQTVSKSSSISTRHLSNTAGDDDDITASAGSGTDQPHLAAPAEPSLVNKSGQDQADPADSDQDEFVMFSGESLTSDRRTDDGFVDLPIMQGAGVMAPPKPELVTKYLSPDHFSATEAYKWKKHELIRELQSFEHDTGSMPVRIGLLTQRIQYLTRHTQDHRKDHHGRRGLLILLSRRRKSLRVLRRKDFDAYVKVLRRFGLKDNYYQSGWGERYRVGTNLKWSPNQTDKERLPPPAQLRAQVHAVQKQRGLTTVRAHHRVRFAMEDDGRNVIWKAGAEPEGPGARVFTPRTVKTHEFNKEKIRQRGVKMTAAWQRRLQGVEAFYPAELSRPEFEQQRLQAAAQRGELKAAELERLQEIRQAQKQTRRARKLARRADIEEAVLPQYKAGPAAMRKAGAAM